MELQIAFCLTDWSGLDLLTPWIDVIYQFGEFIAINLSDIYLLCSSGTPAELVRLSYLLCLLHSLFYFPCFSFVLVSFYLPVFILASFLRLCPVYLKNNNKPSSVEFLILVIVFCSLRYVCGSFSSVHSHSVQYLAVCQFSKHNFYICKHGNVTVLKSVSDESSIWSLLESFFFVCLFL